MNDLFAKVESGLLVQLVKALDCLPESVDSSITKDQFFEKQFCFIFNRLIDDQYCNY